MVIFCGIISIIIFLVYFRDLKRNPITTKQMVIIAMLSGLAFMLSLIKFIRYPQGGGITLFYMIPIMMLSLIYGKTAGVTGGLILGFLILLGGTAPIHPIQFLLDFLLGPMALGLACVFGNDKKYKIILGCLFAAMLCVFSSFVSGVVFFGQYAPKGMNVYLYSFIYNYSSGGVEGILSAILMSLLPINRFRKIALSNNKAA